LVFRLKCLYTSFHKIFQMSLNSKDDGEARAYVGRVLHFGHLTGVYAQHTAESFGVPASRVLEDIAANARQMTRTLLAMDGFEIIPTPSPRILPAIPLFVDDGDEVSVPIDQFINSTPLTEVEYVDVLCDEDILHSPEPPRVTFVESDWVTPEPYDVTPEPPNFDNRVLAEVDNSQTPVQPQTAQYLSLIAETAPEHNFFDAYLLEITPTETGQDGLIAILTELDPEDLRKK